MNPGILVVTYVEHYECNGLGAAFLGSVFRDFIDSAHIGRFFTSEDYQKLMGKSKKKWWR